MPLAEPRWRDSKLCAGSCGTRLARTAQRGVITEMDGKFADSPMEGAEFELLVPQSALNICSYEKNRGCLTKPAAEGTIKPAGCRARQAVV